MPRPITPHPARRNLILLPAVALLALGCQQGATAAAGTTDDAATTAATAVATAVATPHATHAARDATVPASEAVEVDGPEDALGDGSLHDLDMTWRDQDGKARTIAGLGERPLVIAMVYTTCAHTCPLILADLKQLEATLTAAQRAGMTFVLVSLDPENDTPAQLNRFATDSRLDPARWTLLTGTATDVRMLAAALGVRYRPGADGEIAHSNALTIVDSDGAIAYQQRGVGGGSDGARRALVQLLQ
ncbi:MAG: SCO family protein [Gemmatimonadaceae bacterium]